MNIKKLIIFLCFIFGMAFNAPSYADINSDLNSFFNSLGFDNSVSSPGAYMGQEAGYYTGGSLFARTAVRDVQLMQLDMPSWRSGCGGIDMFAGGFSFISKDQLVQLFKNIMNNATSYAFTLAMETATPQLTNVMKYLQNAVNEINKLNVNSCETAVGLVGSVWPRSQEASRRVCEDIGTKKMVFTDYAEAKHGCGSQGQLTSTLGKGGKADKATIFNEGNIAWLAIRQNNFLKTDDELSELFMSISGSIIIHKREDKEKDAIPRDDRKITEDDVINVFIPLPSLATNQQLLKALLYGGSAKIYRCDESNSCLYPRTANINIRTNDALVNQTKKILENIAEKIKVNEAIKTKEIGLLQATSLPVYKMLTIQSAFYKDENILDVSNYSELIAIDILFQYLSESLGVVRASSATLQYPEEIMKGFIAGIDKARSSLRELQKSAYAQITTTAHLIQQTQSIEQMLSGQLSSNLANTLAWTKGER